MKKLLVTFTLLLFPFFVFAISGTCSDHGGVDCNIGPDWDGSAICVDGWSDSSEKYFQQKLCSSAPMCTEYLWNQMSDTLDTKDDKNKYYNLIKLINLLNIEYPMIEIRAQERFRGTGVTRAEAEVEIQSQQRINRRLFATSTYEAKNLDNKLRTVQMEINKLCINQGLSAQKSIVDIKNSNIVTTKQNDLDLNNSPYQNVRDRKIYRDVRLSYATNENLGCSGLGFAKEDLAMCQAFSLDSNKDRWTTIDRPEPELVTTQSLLAKKAKQEELARITTPINVPLVTKITQNLNKIEIKKDLPKNNQIVVSNVTTSISTSTKENFSTSSTTSTTTTKVNIPTRTSLFHKVGSWFKNWFK